MHACVIVSTLEPTLVPKEFATSLAPIPNAKTKAMMNPKMIIHNTVSEYGSIILNADNNNYIISQVEKGEQVGNKLKTVFNYCTMR